MFHFRGSDKMTLAVIIPNYNKSKYIEDCVKSVMQQTLLPDEIWIVDDCSTDNSREIIEKISKHNNRIKTIFFEENQGVSAARNAGILAASTEYITTLDSDDFIYDKNKYSKEIECLEKSFLSGNDRVFAYSKTVYVDEDGIPIPGHRHFNATYLKGDIFIPILARYHFVDTTPRDYCIKKEYLIEAGLYDINSRYFEDLDLLFRVTKKCRAIFSECNGIGYRCVPGGLSQQGKKNHDSTLRKLREKYLVDLDAFQKTIYCLYYLAGVMRKIGRKCYRAFEKIILRRG